MLTTSYPDCCLTHSIGCPSQALNFIVINTSIVSYFDKRNYQTDARIFSKTEWDGM